MSDPTSNDRPTNDRPTNGRNPNAHLADLESDAETGSAADAKKVAADARASATQGPNRAAAAGMPAEKPQDLAGSVKRLAGLMGPERIGAIMVVLLAIVSVTLTVIGPKGLGRATDVIVSGIGSKGGIDYTRLHNTLLLAVGLYLVAWILSYGQNYLLAGVVQRTMSRIRTDVEEKINRLPLSYVDRQPRGDLLSRVTNDIDNVAQSLQQTLGQMLTSLFTIVGVMVMMFIISPLLALVALITIPSALFLTKFIASRSKTKFIAQWKHTGTLNAQVEESFTGHALVKVFGRQAEAEEKFNEVNEELYEASFGAQFISGIIQPAMMFLGNLNFVAIAVIGGLRVASGALSLGDVQAFIQYSSLFNQPLAELGGMAASVQSGVASTERVYELLDEADEVPDDPDAPEPVEGQGRIEFEHVKFSYSPSKPLIEDLSFTVEPGQTVAIVGPTGAGKTTLVNLLMRFYELDGGKITVNGQNIAALKRNDVRRRTGMVLQDPWLFAGTINQNIRYGNEDATDEQIIAAAKATYVDRLVRQLPKGYETELDEDASNLSAGERQLLTIARAFVAQPPILILDEATSSVDTRTERLLQDAMNALQKGRTSFVIAHRLSTIREADLILVMENGAIVEKGTHEELIKSRGAYWRLYNSQFEGAL